MGRERLRVMRSVLYAHLITFCFSVVYGDTDSVFVYLRGKTKAQAFRIGEDIAATITAMNPAPIKLKFEKVFHAVSA